MDVDEILLDTEEKMEKAVDYLKHELRGIRTGRASPALVEFTKVDYYGTMTDLRQIASISVPEPTQLLIKPYDATSIQAIVKALQASGLGLNPVNEGKQIRLMLPALSMERRNQLVGSTKSMAEQAKIAIRNTRRDGNKHVDTAEKGKTIDEDAAVKAREEVQELTKKYEKSVDDLVAAKTKEILEH